MADTSVDGNRKRLAGRRIIITGAASGIGLATTKLFVQEGARVAMVDVEPKGLAREAAAIGSAVHAFSADVGDEAQVRRAVDEAAAAMGGIDGIVNAAGISRAQPFADVRKADWTETLRVNLDGPFHVCSAALPHLRGGASTIVNIASGVALRPIPKSTAYAASKAGLIGFGKALAVDLADQGVRVNTVCPGIIDTPMIHRRMDGEDPDAVKRLFDRRLLKRLGRPEEIAHAILFLTAEDCAYVSGSVFAIDGGGAMY